MMQITDNLTLTLQFSMGLILVKFEEKILLKHPLLLYNDFINIYIQLDWEQVFTTY